MRKDNPKLLHPLEYRKGRIGRRAPDAKVVKIRTEHNSWSVLRTMLSLFLVLLQLGIIVGLCFLPAIVLPVYLVVLMAISVVTAFSVLSSRMDGQTKAVWILFILVFFIFGFIVYFMSDDRVMYRRARKRHKRIFEASKQFTGTYTQPNAGEEMLSVSQYLYNAGGFVPYADTKLRYFPSGASLFDDVIENLRNAHGFVFIEYYAIADGILWNRIWSILEEKLKEGVEVRIVVDDLGGRDLSLKTRRKMRKAGAQVKIFNRLVSRFTFALNFRDHRKIIVIDGKVAYTGGSNVADEYVNEKRMHGYWKDTGLRLEGAAVDAMTLMFLRQWEYIVKKPTEYAPYMNKFTRIYGGGTVVPYMDGPEFELSICKNVFEQVIASARKKLYIMTPYFIPDDSVTQYLVNAALSGVDVRIVLPEIPDKSYVYLLTVDNAERLLKYGVKIYYMRDAFVHSKIIMSEHCAVVGTVNFDMRSFFAQFENAVISDDKTLLSDMERDFAQTFKDSRQAEKPAKNGVLKSVAISVLRFVSPLM